MRNDSPSSTGRPGSYPSKPQAIEEEVDDGSRIEGKDLAHEQAADDRNAERTPQLRSHPHAHRQRKRAQQGRRRGHHDRTEPQQTGFVDRFLRSLPFRHPFAVQREVDHHDGVFFHDADQQHDPDQRDHAQLRLEQEQGQQRADAG